MTRAGPPPVLLAVLALAACGEHASDDAPPAAAAPAAPAAEPPRAPAGPVGFVGRWAADPTRCAQAQHVFTRTALETPDGTFCSFQRVAETPTGWDMQATCGREDGPRAAAAIGLERIGDGLRLRVTGREPVTLRLCPENWAAGLAPAVPGLALEQSAAIDARVASGGAVRPYKFKHQGVIHDAWRENDQVLKVAEKVTGDSRALGGEVVHYFAPGGEEPFLVRDAMGAYAYERGRLTAVYDETGRVLPGSPDAARGARLLERGRALRLAADG